MPDHDTVKIIHALGRAAAQVGNPDLSRSLLAAQDLIHELKRDRDSARRMYCLAAAHIDGNEYPLQVYAARQKWGDLFLND